MRFYTGSTAIRPVVNRSSLCHFVKRFIVNSRLSVLAYIHCHHNLIINDTVRFTRTKELLKIWKWFLTYICSYVKTITILATQRNLIRVRRFRCCLSIKKVISFTYVVAFVYFGVQHSLVFTIH